MNSESISQKLPRLVEHLDQHVELAIAVSGGIDSMVLMHVAHRESHCLVRAFHACSPAVPAAAYARVKRHAADFGWDLQCIDAQELKDTEYRRNPSDRCYFCKRNLYDRIREHTQALIASGTNADDLADYRPGLRAAKERGVVHPYVEVGLTKADIYALATHLGLRDLETLPAQPCLASRVETGIQIEPLDLAFVDAVESRVRGVLGDSVTVRCRITHEGVALESDATNANADIEGLVAELCRQAGRHYLGLRPYRKGAAFIR